MRIRAFPIIASFALFAAPALAQTSGVTSNQPSGMTSNQPYGTSNSPNASSGQQQGVTVDTQQKIRQSLENSGFRNVQVLPEAFVIRAQAPDGSRVVMLLRPDELVSMIQPTGTQSGNRGNMQGGIGSSTQPYGSTYSSPQGNNWGSGQSNMNR